MLCCKLQRYSQVCYEIPRKSITNPSHCVFIDVIKFFLASIPSKPVLYDSLRYWVSEMRVDGFRFDLGTILAREPDGFRTESGFLKAVGQDPLLAEAKLIAEPWDCGPGGYQVGGFPPGWAEWNDTFRDATRDFWRGVASAKTLAPRLCASPDKFNFRGRKPWASVNFVAAYASSGA